MKDKVLDFLQEEIMHKLDRSSDVITANEIKDNLTTTFMGSEIIYFKEVDSTNNMAKKLAREGCKEGTIVIADKQSNGKGRLGRTWASPPNEGIWMSVVLRPALSPNKASQLTLIAGLSMCEVIREITGLDAKIKWPNDIVINGKKVCGILTEMSAQIEDIEYVVVGIGVNVNIEDFPSDLPYATSLAVEGKEKYSRKHIITAFLKLFEQDYKQYIKKQNLIFIKERYEKNCITLNKKVKLVSRETEIIATSLGISSEGAIIVKLEDGTVQEIFTGEVSVRGLYGYI